jgi:hypothetical protein
MSSNADFSLKASDSDSNRNSKGNKPRISAWSLEINEPSLHGTPCFPGVSRELQTLDLRGSSVIKGRVIYNVVFSRVRIYQCS